MANKKSDITLYIKDALRERGVRQEHLSRALEVSVPTISSWCTNKSAPSLEMLARIAEYLQCPISRLLGEEMREDEHEEYIICPHCHERIYLHPKED